MSAAMHRTEFHQCVHKFLLTDQFQSISDFEAKDSKVLHLWLCSPSLKLFIGHLPMCCYNHLPAKNQYTRPCKLPEITDPSEVKRVSVPLNAIESDFEALNEGFAQENTIEKQ